MRKPPFRLVFVAALLATATASPAIATQDRRQVVDRNGNVIAVVEGRARTDFAPAPGPTPLLPSPVVEVPAREGTASPRASAGIGGNDTWPMFQVDARHTGFLPIDLDPTRFTLRWQRDIGGNFALNPVAGGDGKVFVSLDIRFDNVESVFALDVTDGHTIWAKNLGPVNSVNPMSYAYGMAYVQTGKATQGIPPWFRGLDADTGTVVFQSPFSAQWESYFAPTIHDGKAYINGGTYGGMYAFDAFDGTQLWFASTLPQYDQWTPAVDDTRAYAYLGEYQPGLYMLDRATGGAAGFIPDLNFDWSGWSMNLAPVLTDRGDILAIHDGRLLFFDPSTNSIRRELVGPYTGQPSYHAGRVYAVKSGRLVVLDEMTGAEIWAWTPPLVGQIVGPMIVTRSHVIASTATHVYAVSADTHLEVWAYPMTGHLAMADDTLYIASADGRLTAIDAPAGRLQALRLVVDASGGPGSDGNGLLEPGETVGIAPVWLNGSSAALSFTGALTAFSGPGAPGNPQYTIVDAAATYPTAQAGASATCATTGDCYALEVTVPSTRPGTHWDAEFDEEIVPVTLGSAKTWTLHLGDSFVDVPRSSPFYRFVETLLHNDVTGGCTTTAYCPAAATTRAQMAAFVLVAKEGTGYAPPACTTPMFADVPPSSPFCRWIEELARRGVAGGCGAGLYCPGATVTREEMAVFVLLTKEPGVFPPACTTPMFSDVPASSPFCRWIEELARRGVVTGCGGGAYCPAAPVTREQMSVFLTATFGLLLYGP